PPGWTRGAAERPGTGSAATPTLSHQGCSTADQGPGLGPSYLQSGLGGTGIAHHGNSRANVNNVLARNSSAATATVAATLATLDRVVFSLMSSVFHASFRFALAQPRDRSIAGAARCAPDRRPSAEAGVRRARPGRAAGPTLDPVKRFSGTAV